MCEARFERSRVGPAVTASPRNMTTTCFLGGSDIIPLLSIAWKDLIVVSPATGTSAYGITCFDIDGHSPTHPIFYHGQKPTSTSTNTQIDTLTFQNFRGTIDKWV